jgi:dienelactone hydrolase
LRAAVPAEALRLGWTAQTAGLGGVVSVGEPVCGPDEGGLVRVRLTVECAQGRFAVLTSVGAGDLLQGLRLVEDDTVGWQPPPYAHPGGPAEREVLLGDGPQAVPGTLSMPAGAGPFPAVVLLSGGGPFDRDGSAGPNKPLKDLAWGLAARGVAALRFDKATVAHPATLPPDHTMADEYLPPALAAVRLLREQPAVAAERVHLVGHSMGGKIAPRIAAADPAVAGLVLLAADSVPMHEAAVRVARHLAAQAPGPQADRFVAELVAQAARVADPALTPDTPAALLPLGLSAAYWLDLRAYDPVATAVALDRPMLLLQGGRDYQVTVADDLARWRAALADRPDVTIRVHENADHFFFPGSGPAGPTDHLRPGHVLPAVVDEIAAWLTRGSAAG